SECGHFNFADGDGTAPPWSELCHFRPAPPPYGYTQKSINTRTKSTPVPTFEMSGSDDLSKPAGQNIVEAKL
ncbi:hypothetical protein, partial [Cupriavidus pinatubonensis]|uniref:hypothetical protein n=1 Tax=Cupriavidus pinatubonensis TaxID=248026 RepID=UPI0036184CAD